MRGPLTPRVPRSLALSVGVLAIFYVIFQLAVPPYGFFSGDQGAKFLQTEAFATQGPRHATIDVRARDIDPDAHYQILLLNRGGRIVGVFSWLMPMLGAPFVRVFGMRGLYVVPMLSGIAIFLAAAALGRRMDLGSGLWTAWIAVLCAPVLFYGSELWEHAPAAACVIWAAVLTAPDDRQLPTSNSQLHKVQWFAGGALIGGGALFREEAIVALPAFLIASALSDRGWGPPSPLRRFGGTSPPSPLRRLGGMAAGCAVVFIAAIPVNLVVYGSALPLHLVTEVEKTAGYLDTRLLVFKQLLLPAFLAPLFLVAAVVAVALFLPPDQPSPRLRRSAEALRAKAEGGSYKTWGRVAAAWILIAIGALIPLWRMAVLRIPQFNAYSLDSIAHTWVFWVAALFAGSRARGGTAAAPVTVRFLLMSAILIVAGALLIIPSPGGAQWSPRYLFIAAPLLAVAASRGARDFSGQGGAIVWTARAALLCAIVMQVCGLAYLVDAKDRNARITDRLAAAAPAGDVVITDIPWFPQVTATLLRSRRILLARSPAQVGQIVELAAQHEFRSVAVVSSIPETQYEAPHAFASGGNCTFVRTDRMSLGERGLVVHRYTCSLASGVIK